MNKKTYTSPEFNIIEIKHEGYLMRTSREAEVGGTSPNQNKDHYLDPTGPVENWDGGESL
uniref:Uncharacterized protein n=5 Tax=unclassified Prevotella TaxID=2638335 RepID=A0AB33JIJ7_9BACT